MRGSGVEPIRAAECQLVVVGDGLALGDQEHGVLVGPARLQAADVAVVLRGGEQAHRQVLVASVQRVEVELVDLLAQHHALAGAHGFAPLVGLEVGDSRASISGLRQLALGEACVRRAGAA